MKTEDCEICIGRRVVWSPLLAVILLLVILQDAALGRTQAEGARLTLHPFLKAG